MRLGRDVAARVPSIQPEYTAWVYVYPIMEPLDAEDELLLREAGTTGHTVVTKEGNPIRGFVVRYLEIENAIAEQCYKGEREGIEVPASDYRTVVTDEEELATVLQRWVSDFMTLRVPLIVGYQFGLGNRLEFG